MDFFLKLALSAQCRLGHTSRWTWDPGRAVGSEQLTRTLAKMGADLDSWIAKVRACEYLPENDLKQLCQMVRFNALRAQQTICADVREISRAAAEADTYLTQSKKMPAELCVVVRAGALYQTRPPGGRVCAGTLEILP